MDKKYKDIHILTNRGDYPIRQVTDICLRSRGEFVEIEYLTVPTLKECKLIVPCVEGLKIYID